MDFASAKEWLDEMLEFSPTAQARELIAKGKDREAVIRFLMQRGCSRAGAKDAFLYARRHPQARPTAVMGTSTGRAVMVRIAPESVETLKEAAAKRGVSLHLLASKIVALVVEDEMIDAVLDDQR